jgi:hypothetical protein
LSPRWFYSLLVLQDQIVLQKKTVVILRTGKIARDFPERKRAVVNYPIVKGGVSDPPALKSIRSLLNMKNIFDTSLEEYRQDTWLSELDYKVNYNKNFILDITFTQDGVGAYPDSQQKHLAINLRNGQLIKANSVFKPESLDRLAKIVDDKLQAEIAVTLKEVSQDQSIDAEEKKSVPELFERLKIEVKDLDDFSIDDKGITFIYDAGFPHVIQAYQPVGRYHFTYAELSEFLQRAGAPQTLTR